MPPRVGANAVAAPVVARSSATPGRAAPPMLVKPPTAYTLLRPGDTTISFTVQSELGLNGWTARVAALTAATRRLSTPPTLVNVPPTYSVDPAAASVSTEPFAPAYQVRTAAPVVALTAAR